MEVLLLGLSECRTSVIGRLVMNVRNVYRFHQSIRCNGGAGYKKLCRPGLILSVTSQKIHIDEITGPVKLRILQNLLSEQRCLVTNSCYERLNLEHEAYFKNMHENCSHPISMTEYITQM